MAAEGPLTSEQAQGEFADGFNGANYKTALNIGHSYPLTCINRKPLERTINNNNVWGKSPMPEFLPSAQELGCCDFVDSNCAILPTPNRHALNSGTEWSEKDGATDDFALENSRPEKSAEPKPAKTMYERSTSAEDNLEKENETFTANISDIPTDALVQNEPLSLKERISNIDLSIEWIKCELTLMRAQDFSLKQQFEQLFREVMEFKLRMEMEKDEEEEQFIDEDMSFEAE